ncbi:DNA methyltransferase [Aequorivita marina]|uniref:DNA methyltransferase n=1 Tax=Aequorivita marina TaxID=3073654 RepID=UPI002876F776|nr:DNA methyltransferase [Aequorivita sp. S2608]MDS1299187.1 DNA methyltransferase [Aequorivita sp. S2608]
MPNTDTSDKITVLGKTFNSEEERRTYFREELRKKLPELKKMDGFPIGEDEDILNLSDPPFYTACPNPWLNDFVAEWEEEKKALEKEGKRDADFEVTEPYAADVSEGKNNPIYNAHSYHTKVPHPAIMRYLLHYTQPGDIIFDGFAGTGMTGVAASFISDNKNPNGIRNYGKRHSILGDLSPIATLISHNFNSRQKTTSTKKELNKIIEETWQEVSWMYETKHTKNIKGFIDNTIWSDIFLCESCQGQIIYWDAVVDYENKKISSTNILCKSCGHQNSRRGMERSFTSIFDKNQDTVIRKAADTPVMIEYSVGTKRYKKSLNDFDKELLSRIDTFSTESLFLPKSRMMEGKESRRNDKLGMTHTYHYFTRRNLITLGVFYNKIVQSDNFLKHLPILTASISRATQTNRFRFGGTGGLSGTLYIPSLKIERSAIPLIKSKFRDIYKAEKIKTWTENLSINTTQSATDFPNFKANSVDYIFTDPPFGSNIYYSELNFISEDWLKVYQNISKEAIENSGHGKGFVEYINLMSESFRNYFRVLKPGKWMTVEFSNTSAAIWNGIQTSIQNAGFIISNVAGLDRKQGTFKTVTTATAVKQDLVISCYKPSSEFDKKFNQNKNSNVSIWDFVEEHLNHLPIHLVAGNSTTAIIERSPKILFDRLIAFYVQRGLPVPIDAGKFQQGLRERFIERDGMFFTNEQVQEYDKKKKENPEFIQLSLLVSTEQDGVLWLKNLLSKEHLTYQDIQPQWMQALAGVRKGDVIPELATILEENFLKDDEGKWYAPDPENEADLEKLRNTRLLRLFEGYKKEIENPRAKIKEVRVEALRAGFKQCYQDKDFKTIVSVGDRIPNNLLMEDEVLLQFYDIASSRI